MKLVQPSFEILEMTGIDLIEKAGRTCYKSEDKITEDSAVKFVEMLDSRGHRAMLEHSFASVRVICDRGVTHEIVRHRLFSYAQESTRYCNYGNDKFGKEVTFILPPWMQTLSEGKYEYVVNSSECIMVAKDGQVVHRADVSKDESYWMFSCLDAEKAYLRLLEEGWAAQQARGVLPNCLKTEIVISGNFREWQHFFNLRTAKAAHPQMREIAEPLCREFEKRIPAIKWREE